MQLLGATMKHETRAGIYLVSFLLCLLSPRWAAAVDFSGEVVGVYDGDILTVLHDGVGKRIRLKGIDAPEKDQAFGWRARNVTSELAFGKTVRVVPHEVDKYGRTAAEVILPDGRVLNELLIQAGMAWWNRKDSDSHILQDLEAEARKERQGLWADSHPIPPWEWRDNQRSKYSTRPNNPPRNPPRAATGRPPASVLGKFHLSSDFDPTIYLGQGNAFNCADFSSQAQAQAVLQEDWSDPNKLDLDKNGIACEHNPGPFDRFAIPRIKNSPSGPGAEQSKGEK